MRPLRSSMLRSSLCALALLATLLPAPPIALAAPGVTQEVRRQIESSLGVRGQIRIDAAGNVLDYTLDDAEKLPKGIVDTIARLAPQWKFEPVALGEHAVSRSRMHLLFVARKLDSGDFRIELRSASFDADLPENQRISIARRGRMPQYPDELLAEGVAGTVYLSVQVGRDGKVANVDASHVNLRTLGSEEEMSRWRAAFSRASLKAIRGWTFAIPSEGEAADDPHWIGTLPVEFTIGGAPERQPGKWEAYIPGPRRPIPWADSVGITAENSDALPSNQFHDAANGRRLLTPLTGG